MNNTKKKDLIKQLELIYQLYKSAEQLKGDGRMAAYEQCQSAAIDIGNILEEENYNETVHKLEELCEIIYLLSSESDDGDKNYSRGNQIFEKVIAEIKKIKPVYLVAFLPYKAAMWDALESVWIAFQEDKRFETIVMPIPYYEADVEKKEWIPKYDGEIFPTYVEITDYHSYSLEAMHPDIIFIHNPYDDSNVVTSVHPFFFSSHLKKCTENLVYIPYYMNMGFQSVNQRNLPVHKNMDYMIVQNDRAKECCKEDSYYEKILPLGSPKFDKIINASKNKPYIPTEWATVIENKRVLFLNTTIQELLDHGEDTFEELKNLFETTKNRKTDIAIIWRPHPLLMATIMAMRLSLKDKYCRLIEDFKVSGIGIIDDTPDINNTILLSDAYIGSQRGSAIIPFQVLGKPIYRLWPGENKYIENICDPISSDPLCHFYRLNKWEYYSAIESANYTVEMFLDDLCSGRLDGIKERQIAAIQDINASFDGKCGERIYTFFRDKLLTE